MTDNALHTENSPLGRVRLNRWLGGVCFVFVAVGGKHRFLTPLFSPPLFSPISGAGSDWSAETLTTCCTLLVQGLLASFGISLFWTSVTIIYLLLRQSVDKMPLDRIAPSDQERPSPRPPARRRHARHERAAAGQLMARCVQATVISGTC